MNTKKFIVYTILLLAFESYSQKVKRFIKEIGSSALSGNTLAAKTFSFEYAIYDTEIDSTSNKLFFTTRKPSIGKQFSKMGSLGLLEYDNDSLSWNVNVTQFKITNANSNLLISNESKTSRYNKTYGYEQFQYPGKIVYSFSNNTGLMYTTNNSNDLKCVQLSDGIVKWSASIPSSYNWNDVKKLNDSVYIIAAGGIHAININTGKLWSHELVTTDVSKNAFTYSALKANNLANFFNAVTTNTFENQITSIASNILIDSNSIYFATKNKVLSTDYLGKINWEYDLTNVPASCMLLRKATNNLTLFGLGVASYNDNSVLYGKPFVLKLNAATGKLESNTINILEGITDFCLFKQDLIFANKKSISQTIIANSEQENILDVGENKFGRFNEFIDGDKYYVEREGFYVPLNFINDNVFYFKAENEKVYGVSNSKIEYEYHFSELYNYKCDIGTKKILTQRNKTILTTKNFELMATFKTDAPLKVLKDKIYFIDEKLLYVIHLKEL